MLERNGSLVTIKAVGGNRDQETYHFDCTVCCGVPGQVDQEVCQPFVGDVQASSARSSCQACIAQHPSVHGH